MARVVEGNGAHSPSVLDIIVWIMSPSTRLAAYPDFYFYFYFEALNKTSEIQYKCLKIRYWLQVNMLLNFSLHQMEKYNL